MTELGPDDEALLRDARMGLRLSDADNGRIKRRVFTRLGLGIGAAGSALSASATASAGSVVAGSGALTVVKVLGGILVVGGLVGAGSLAIRQPAPVTPPRSVLAAPAQAGAVAPPPSSRATTASIPPAPALSVALPVVAEHKDPPAAIESPAIQARGAIPAKVTSAPAASVPEETPVAPSAASPVSVALEARLLREADAALRAGDGLRALSLLEEHAASCPNGTLVEERDAERITVLCSLGRKAQARDAAAAFQHDHPRSPLAARVRSACAAE